MSYSADFRAVFPDTLGGREVLSIARKFAARWGARTCQVSGYLEKEALQVAAAIVDAHGISLEIVAQGELSLPMELFRDGAAAYIQLYIFSGSHPQRGTCLELKRNEGRVTTTMQLTGLRELSPTALDGFVRERIELARSVSALSPRVSFAPPMAGGNEIDIPLLPDSFERLAGAVAQAEGCNDVELRSRILPGHASSLVRALGALEGFYSVTCENLAIDVDDDSGFEMLGGLVDHHRFEIRWDSGPDGEWITGSDRWCDGELQYLTMHRGVAGIDVVAHTFLDHISRDDVVAWLEARAGVPMVYDDTWDKKRT